MAQNVKSQLDYAIGRILFVDVQPDSQVVNRDRAERVFGVSLLFSGVRCIIQYAILPFVLPALGIAGDVAIPLMLMISVLALVSIVASLRRFWKIGYEHRWQYLVVALAALVILGAFITMDVLALVNA